MTIPIDRQIAAVRDELKEMRDALTIPLRRGGDLIIERRDLWLFTSQNWWFRPHRNTGYLTRLENSKFQHLHREVIAAPDGFFVDHINGNGLDNRRSNLRLATSRQNNWNRARQRDLKRGFLGVSLHTASGLWRARLRVFGGRELTTYHDTSEAAARAYDAMAVALRGDFACLNFPQEVADRRIAEMEAVRATLERVRDEESAKVAPGLPL